MVIGGPYRDKPRELKGVKLAKEIDAPFDVKLDIADFSVPDEAECYVAVMETLDLLNRVKCAYVGCMGGIGRTGMFLALLVKAVGYYNLSFQGSGWRYQLNRIKSFFGFPTPLDQCRLMINKPVEYVRKHYMVGAVETSEQYEFVRNFEFNQWEITELETPLGVLRTAVKKA